MDIDKQYAWQPAEDCRTKNPLLPRNLRGMVIGKSGCGETTAIFNLLLQHGWLDYNHLYVFGKSLHQQQYKVLRIRIDAGSSKQQISDLFKERIYHPTQKNLLLLDDCFPGKLNKAEAYYIRDRHNNCDTIYIGQNYFRLPRHTIRDNSNFIIMFPQDVENLPTLTIALVIYPSRNSRSFAMEYGAARNIIS